MEKVLTDERGRAVVDTSTRVAMLFDSSFNLEYCNPAAYELFGFISKEDFYARFVEYTKEHTPETLSNGKPSVSIIDRLTAVAEEGSAKMETELLIDGATLVFDVEMQRISYGESFGIACFISDITDIRRHEQELTHANEQIELQLAKLNMVMKAAELALWDMAVVQDDPANPDNPIMWSDEIRYMLGYTDENDFPNILDSWTRLVHPEDLEAVVKAFIDHLFDTTGQTSYSVECRVKTRSGEYGFFRTTGETIRDAKGNPLRVVGALIDINDTKTLIREIENQRAEAEAANKAKSSFLSMMSHEIRTPMNAILGITEILLQNESLDLSTREALGKIFTSGDLLLNIINDILDLSKIEVGKMELLNEQYSVSSLISDSVQVNMMRIGSKPIQFDLSIDENIPSQLLGDELRVKQVLNNLLSNAFKYTAAGSVKLEVATHESEKDSEIIIIVRISDTGRGMTKEQVQKIFDEYSRFDMAANRTTEGTGLGMSITQNLISLMDGSISIESEPGKGSVVTVRLPQGRMDCEALGSERARSLEQFRTSSFAHTRRTLISYESMPYGRVLIVDDVEANIYVAKGLLAPYKLTIEHVISGFDAIEKIKNGSVYDIIFMDYMMPIMDGLEATKIIRDMGYAFPIVALTADAVSGQAELLVRSGFDDFISKPIDTRQLNTVLNKLIRDKQPPEVIAAARAQTETTKEAASEIEPQPSVDPQFAEILARDSAKALEGLKTIHENNDYQNEDNLRKFIIHTHSMKTIFANIGRADLSEFAQDLETAGRNKTIETVISQIPDFLSLLQSFVNATTQQANADEGKVLEEDTLHLAQMLNAIAQACKKYDGRAADEALAELQKTAWQTQTSGFLSMIAQYLLHSDFEEAVKEIEDWLLRCAQDDKAAAQDDKAVAQDDKAVAQDDK